MAQSRQPRTPQTMADMMNAPGAELPPEDLQEQPQPTPPEPPAGTSITINGRQFTVDSELASALEGREQEFNRRLSEQGREVGELRTWRRQMEAQRQPTTPDPNAYNYNVRLFEAPEEALMRVKREAKEEAISEMRSAYHAERQQEQTWQRFYKDNPDLADEPRLVRAIATELLQAPEWDGSQDMRGFLSAVAQEARGELLRISRRSREADAPAETLPNQRRPVEGGGQRRAAAPAADTGPVSLSSEIQRRQRRFRAAAE